MGENTVLLNIGALTVTAYSLSLTAGVVAAILLTILLGKKRFGTDHMLKVILCVIPCALIGGHLLYCLMKLQDLMADYVNGAALILMPWMGGYTLYGSILGGLLGLYLADRKHFPELADIAAPGAMLMLSVARAAEYFTGEGLGTYLEEGSLNFFPFGLCTYADEYWSEWRIPVFVWETAAALILCVVAVCLLRNMKQHGLPACCILAVMSAVQVLLESLREDELIRFGFVRFNQIMAAVVLLAILLIRIRRMESPKAWQIIRTVLFVAGVGGLIAIEFALDKSTIDNLPLYICMGVLLVMMSVCVLKEKKKVC